MKILRLSYGLTQTELCGKLFITRSTYCCYENGSKTPDLNTVDRLAKFYNVSFEALISKDFSDSTTRVIYIGYATEHLKEVLKKYESLSSVSKKLIMERLNILLERELIFYQEYDISK